MFLAPVERKKHLINHKSSESSGLQNMVLCSLSDLHLTEIPSTKAVRHINSSLPSTLNLVGGFNPFEKYDRQIGSFPQVGMKIEYI